LLEGAAKLETPPKRHNHGESVQQNEEEKKGDMTDQEIVSVILLIPRENPYQSKSKNK